MSGRFGCVRIMDAHVCKRLVCLLMCFCSVFTSANLLEIEIGDMKMHVGVGSSKMETGKICRGVPFQDIIMYMIFIEHVSHLTRTDCQVS